MTIKRERERKKTSVAKDMEKPEPLYTANENVTVENCLVVPQKLKSRISI